MIIPNSPLVDSSIILIPNVTTPVISTPPPKKDFNCKICTKTYNNYMSLYMHKKTKHPNTGPPGSQLTSPTNGNVQVLSLGMSPLTTSGRREKVHQCAQCHKRYADLKGLAGHIEKMHSSPVMTPVTP